MMRKATSNQLKGIVKLKTRRTPGGGNVYITLSLIMEFWTASLLIWRNPKSLASELVNKALIKFPP